MTTSSGCTRALRPLLAGESDQTSKLSREHACVSPVPGLVIVAGGKYTTYRVMAKDGVDLAVKVLDRPVSACPSRTRSRWSAPRATRRWSTPRTCWPRGPACRSTGSSTCSAATAPRSARFSTSSPSDPALGQPLNHAPRYLRVEARYAASHEGALHLDDILARRLRVSVDTWDRGVDVANEVAEIVAPVLGWDEAAISREVEHYRKRVAAERDSQDQLDDRTADSARLGAPEVRVGVG